jgi:PTS system galactitol-specific IIA component
MMELKCYQVKGPRELTLSFLADQLLEQGYVNDDFKRCLLERERIFPTGLNLCDSVNVAIPHTECCYVKKDLFVIGVSEEPIIFNRIDEPEEELPVNVIFLFAIVDPKSYLPILASLTENFSNEDFLDCIKLKDSKKIEEYLCLHVLV